MRFGSLFAGIGGFDLGLERAGMECAFQVENDDYCNRVLAARWPDVPRFGDVRSVGVRDLPPADLLCGGFPCQDLSSAGRQAGLDGERSGLWFEYERIVGELRPRWVVVENIHHMWRQWVPFVRGALHRLGYASLPLRLRACDFGAPHRRARCFVVAHADGSLLWDELWRREWERSRQAAAELGEHGAPQPLADADGEGDAQQERSLAEVGRRAGDGGGQGGDVADPDGERRHRRAVDAQAGGQEAGPHAEGGHAWAAEPDVGGTLDGFSAWLDRCGLNEAHTLVLGYANAAQARPEEIVRTLRGRVDPQDDGWAAGGQGCVSSQAVLFAYLRQLEEGPTDETWIQLAGEEASSGSVRSLSSGDQLTGAPRQRQAGGQRGGEHSDSLRSLSQVLARHAESAWAAYRRQNAAPLLSSWSDGWEDGFARIAYGVPSRVDRLRGLGNAVLPQIAEWLGGMVMGLDARWTGRRFLLRQGEATAAGISIVLESDKESA